MNKYIRCNLVQAVPQVRTLISDNNEVINQDGYKVVYQNGYESWCPKEEFEKNSLEVFSNKKLTNSPISVSKDMIIDLIQRSTINTQTIDGKTTIVHCVLPNGFTMVESSSCVDPLNYQEDIGRQICLENIENKLWGLLGFLLCSAKEGFKNE